MTDSGTRALTGGLERRLRLAAAALVWERLWPALWPAVATLGVFLILAWIAFRFAGTSITLAACSRPSCLIPMFTTGTPSDVDSMMPLLELPTSAPESLSRLK